jgi:hypothetical protein
MAREISLSGGDISVIKALGVSGAAVLGNSLMDRLGEMEEAELVDTLQGLIAMGYVISNATQLRRINDVEKATFKVNASMMRDLRTALHPQIKQRERRRRA